MSLFTDWKCSLWYLEGSYCQEGGSEASVVLANIVLLEHCV